MKAFKISPVVLRPRCVRDEELEPFFNIGIALQKDQIVKFTKRTENLINSIFSERKYFWHWKEM